VHGRFKTLIKHGSVKENEGKWKSQAGAITAEAEFEVLEDERGIVEDEPQASVAPSEEEGTCGQCVRAVAEYECKDCGEIYCRICLEKVHGENAPARKQKHLNINLIDSLIICDQCSVKLAVVSCPNCNHDNYCKDCNIKTHSKGQRKTHQNSHPPLRRQASGSEPSAELMPTGPDNDVELSNGSEKMFEKDSQQIIEEYNERTKPLFETGAKFTVQDVVKKRKQSDQKYLQASQAKKINTGKGKSSTTSQYLDLFQKGLAEMQQLNATMSQFATDLIGE